MRFTEIDVFGVYVAPMSLTMVAAWFVTIALRHGIIIHHSPPGVFQQHPPIAEIRTATLPRHPHL
jgi:Protein of unknown function (DUF1656)